jgi:hypothetical protein
MIRRRDIRERQALKYLAERNRASALDLGTAAVAGERPHNWKARAGIGLALGVHFVERGFARPTRFNQFEWVPPTN